MYDHLELAYLGIEVPEPASLDAVLRRRHRPRAGRRRSVPRRTPGATTPRRTGSSSKPATPTTPSFVGFEATDDAAFDAVAELIRSSGHELTEAAAHECAARGVARLGAPRRRGVCRSSSSPGWPTRPRRSRRRSCRRASSPRASASGTSCSPPRAFDESHAFAHRRPRARSSPTGWRWSSRPASSSRCASTTATRGTTRVALARAPFELPQALHHVMFETNDRDDVGAAFDRAWATGPADPERARPSRQRRHVQLLRAEPGRLPGRGRPRRPRRHRRLGRQPPLRPHQRRGATSRCASHERIRAAGVDVDVDVAIVGCGPVGIALAILLAQRGRTVIVLERWPRAVPAAAGGALRPRGRPHPPVVRHRRRARPRSREPAEVYEWRNADRHDAAALRPDRRPARRAGRCRRCSASRRSRRCSTRGRASCRRSTSAAASRSPALDQDDDGVTVVGRRADGHGGRAQPLRRRLRRREQHRPRPRRPAGARPRVLLRLADRRRRPRRAAGVRPDQPADLRPGPADHGRCPADPAGAGGSSCACRTRTLDELNDDAAAWELLAPWDVHPGNAVLERHAVYTFNARYAEQWRARAGAPRRRRRPPDAAVRRPGHVLRASATPPTSRGSSTSCSAAHARRRAARHLRRGAAAERARRRSSSRWSSARSSASPTRPRPRPATRRWPPRSPTMPTAIPPLPGLDRCAPAGRRSASPGTCSSRATSRPAAVGAASTTSTAPAGAWSRSIDQPIEPASPTGRVVRLDRRLDRRRRPCRRRRRHLRRLVRRARCDLGAAASRLPPLRHRAGLPPAPRTLLADLAPPAYEEESDHEARQRRRPRRARARRRDRRRRRRRRAARSAPIR